MNVTRRGIFGLFGGVVGSAVLPNTVVAKQEVVQHFKWYSGYSTFGPQAGKRIIDTTSFYSRPYASGFSEMITRTLRARSQTLADSISRDNPMIAKLKYMKRHDGKL